MARLGPRAGWLVATGLAVVIGATSCQRPSGPHQRIVLITLDTLRSESLFGDAAHPSQMPLTKAWAEQGTIFDQHYSATSSTQPSHATMFTALQPWQHGISRNGQILAAKHTTIATRLQRAGFATAAVVASMPLHRRFGFAQGFDVYRDDIFTRGFDSQIWEGIAVDRSHFYALADTVTQTAIDLLRRTAAERQFFWFHYFDAHEPYGDTTGGPMLTSKSALDKVAEGPEAVADTVRRSRELYAADAAFLDRSLDRLLRQLHDDARTIETHVVVVADHGESLGEDGVMGHGKHLTDVLIHVPLFVLSPRLARGVRHDAVGSVDLTPTLLALAGVPESVPAGHDFTAAARESRRLFGMRRTFTTPFTERRLDGSTHTLEPYLFYVVDDGVIYTGNSTGVLGPDDRVKTLDAVATTQMTDLFRSFEGELSGLAVEEALDPATQNALRALGYVR